MNEIEIRFECLKLAYRHDLTVKAVLERATEMVEFVEGSVNTAPPKPTLKLNTKVPSKT